MPRASIGRDVHYVARGSADGKFPKTCRAAKITDIDLLTVCDQCDERCADCPEDHGGPLVCLTVFNPTGLFFDSEVEHDPTGETPGSWHWPERVGE